MELCNVTKWSRLLAERKERPLEAISLARASMPIALIFLDLRGDLTVFSFHVTDE